MRKTSITHTHIVDSWLLRSMQDEDDDRLFFLAAYVDRDEPIKVCIEMSDMDALSLRQDDMQKIIFRQRN